MIERVTVKAMMRTAHIRIELVGDPLQLAGLEKGPPA
jgi:hypothetical protein